MNFYLLLYYYLIEINFKLTIYHSVHPINTDSFYFLKEVFFTIGFNGYLYYYRLAKYEGRVESISLYLTDDYYEINLSYELRQSMKYFFYQNCQQQLRLLSFSQCYYQHIVRIIFLFIIHF